MSSGKSMRLGSGATGPTRTYHVSVAMHTLNFEPIPKPRDGQEYPSYGEVLG